MATFSGFIQASAAQFLNPAKRIASQNKHAQSLPSAAISARGRRTTMLIVKRFCFWARPVFCAKSANGEKSATRIIANAACGDWHQ